MRAFVTSDLHIYNKSSLNQAEKWVKDIVNNLHSSIDAIVLLGDIFERSYDVNPYKQLHYAFNYGVPIICCLGNHEFYSNPIDDTLKKYRDLYNPKKWDIHYLDIVGHHDIGSRRFVGNVLWYDGSMKSTADQMMGDFANGGWPDCSIPDFNWSRRCADCVSQIMDNRNCNMLNILCTHCVPHVDLNGHIKDKPMHSFNAYSGIADFLTRVHFDFAFCGHTHYRVGPKNILGCVAENVGCAGFYPMQYSVVDI